MYSILVPDGLLIQNIWSRGQLKIFVHPTTQLGNYVPASRLGLGLTSSSDDRHFSANSLDAKENCRSSSLSRWFADWFLERCGRTFDNILVLDVATQWFINSCSMMNTHWHDKISNVSSGNSWLQPYHYEMSLLIKSRSTYAQTFVTCLIS